MGIICAAVTMAYMLIIFTLSSENGDETVKTSLGLAEMIAKLFYGSPGMHEINDIHTIIRKTAHIALFGGAGVLITLSLLLLTNLRVRFCVLISCVPTLFAAVFDEWHKQFISGRHFDVPEAFLNAFSGLAGILLAALIIHALRKKEAK